MGKSKSKKQTSVENDVNEIMPYASQEEQDEFLRFSDDESAMDCCESEKDNKNAPRACDIDSSEEEEEDEEMDSEDSLDDNKESGDDKSTEEGESESEIPPDRKEMRDRLKVMNERNKRTLFVGNITPKITQKVLKQLFNSKEAAGPGAVESIRIRGAVTENQSMNSNDKRRSVILKKYSDNENQVLCAYVVFKSVESIDKGLKLNGTVIDGKHIRVDRLKGKKMTYQPDRSVFVGNLPYGTNEECVREAFNKCGEIVNVRLVRNKKDGALKGIGFVEFTESMAVDFALKLNGSLQMDNRTIRIEKWSGGKTQIGKRKSKNVQKTNEKMQPAGRKKIITPTNLKGLELKEFIERKKKKLTKKSEKRKKFVFDKKNKKTIKNKK